MKKRKVLIVTERRADFSRFKPIIDKINLEKNLDYILVVTGIHMLKKYGRSINEIKKIGFNIHDSFNMYPEDLSKKNDDGASMSKSLGIAIIEISKILKKTKPDLVLSGFDIAANLAVTISAAHMNIPVAHIQGGEVSGTIDESIRHAMSKFAHYHLASNQDAKKRLIKMGEKKQNIFVVGCPSIEALFSQKKLGAIYFKKKIGLDIKKKYLVVIQHSVTSELSKVKFQIRETIKAIKKFKMQTLFVCPNNDAGSTFIIDEIKSNSSFYYSPTLELNEYRTLLENCFALVGNSSSGIHEASSFKKPVINIGTRQNGRLRSKNIIDVDYSSKKILKELKLLNNQKKYKKLTSKLINPYAAKNTSQKIINIIKKIDISENAVQKKITY